ISRPLRELYMGLLVNCNPRIGHLKNRFFHAHASLACSSYIPSPKSPITYTYHTRAASYFPSAREFLEKRELVELTNPSTCFLPFSRTHLLHFLSQVTKQEKEEADEEARIAKQRKKEGKIQPTAETLSLL
ncbi:hypothetical protein TWF281_008776, partial [Arthrobotrys megalospora]